MYFTFSFDRYYVKINIMYFFRSVFKKLAKTKKNKADYSLFFRFLHYYKPYKLILAVDLTCAALSTVCEIVFPLIVRHITQSAQAGRFEGLLKTVAILCGLYLLLRIVDTAANYYMAYTGHVMGAKIEADMRGDLFSHILRLPFSYFDDVKIGDLMSRMTNDLFDITEFSHHCPEEYFIAAIKITIAFIVLSFINLPLTLIMFALLPFMALSAIVFRKKMTRAFKKSRVQIGVINSGLEDSLSGIRVVKSFTNEDKEIDRFEQNNSNFVNIKAEAYRYMAGFQGGIRFFDGLMYILVVLIGTAFMVKGTVQSADLIAFLLYIGTLLTSVRRIVEFTEQFQRGMTGIERFYEIIDKEPDLVDKEGVVDIGDVHGDITFNNVTFSYNDMENVLENITFEIKKGDSAAFVGPSGGGKTTLCNLIPRFYEIAHGEILIDGTDIRDISLSSLRKNVGIVQQDVYLFGGTVAENIAYGKRGATLFEIEDAAKKAGAHEFISSLENGYDTYVGERGVKLSGGQKQRISIARLFLKNPPILILDEATSALDNESEKIVQSSLELLAKNRTTFTIAHRLTTIRGASVIFVLTDDGIVETGTHEELLKKGGQYEKLYSLYSK